jgi:hypothetical protein
MFGLLYQPKLFIHKNVDKKGIYVDVNFIKKLSKHFVAGTVITL